MDKVISYLNNLDITLKSEDVIDEEQENLELAIVGIILMDHFVNP